jgi:hypothetical protein
MPALERARLPPTLLELASRKKKRAARFTAAALMRKRSGFRDYFLLVAFILEQVQPGPQVQSGEQPQLPALAVLPPQLQLAPQHLHVHFFASVIFLPFDFSWECFVFCLAIPTRN